MPLSVRTSPRPKQRPCASSGLCWRKQQPFVGPERPVKPQRVRGDGRGELRAVAALAQTVHRSQRGADQGEVGGVRRESGGQSGVDIRCAHPEFELRRAGRGDAEVVDRARLPGNEVECEPVLRTEHRRNVGDGLVLGSVLDHVHADRAGGQYAAVGACRAVIVSVANERPSWCRIAS